MLAEFGSVVDAMRCALDVQRGMAERNAKRLQDAQAQLHQYIRDTAGSSGP